MHPLASAFVERIKNSDLEERSDLFGYRLHDPPGIRIHELDLERPLDRILRLLLAQPILNAIREHLPHLGRHPIHRELSQDHLRALLIGPLDAVELRPDDGVLAEDRFDVAL